MSSVWMDGAGRGLARHWGWIVLRGVAAILFGVLALALPGPTLAAMTLLWGAWALADGVLALASAWRARDRAGRQWPLVAVGVLGILVGAFTVAWPGATALSLLLLIAAWAIVTGVLQVVAAIRLRKVIDNELWLGLSGLLSVAFGVLMVLNPAAGAVAVAWTIGAFAVAFGAALVMLGLRLRRAASAG
jgi:uncharacterized membrane protein HdeD (DUF308 family)